MFDVLSRSQEARAAPAGVDIQVHASEEVLGATCRELSWRIQITCTLDGFKARRVIQVLLGDICKLQSASSACALSIAEKEPLRSPQHNLLLHLA